VRPPNRVHIVGASGSGTTSLAVAIAARFGHRHLDTDDFFWMRTDPPFREKRPHEERLALLIPQFELVVFLVVPTPVRLARLRARAVARYGRHAIAPGGRLHAAHVEFLEWAGRYDAGDLEMRSHALHEAWLAALPCPVVRLDGDRSIDEQLAALASRLARLTTSRARTS